MSLSGKLIFVLEDESLISMGIESDLLLLGCRVLGPAASVDRGLQLLARQRPDAALLDVNLAWGERSDRVAERMAEMGVPFAFATAHGRDLLPERFRDHAVLSKPFDLDSLDQLLRSLLPTEGATKA